jgi:hypothetical protein
MIDKDKNSYPILGIRLLIICVILYYSTGMFGYAFPINQVSRAVPVAVFSWLLCSFADPAKYRNIFAAISCIIFASCVICGVLLILEETGKHPALTQDEKS